MRGDDGYEGPMQLHMDLAQVASRDWCKNRLTRFLSIILRGGCNSLVDHLLIVLSVIGRDQLVPQVL
jgi:hypothetical protein